MRRAARSPPAPGLVPWRGSAREPFDVTDAGIAMALGARLGTRHVELPAIHDVRSAAGGREPAANTVEHATAPSSGHLGIRPGVSLSDMADE